MSTQQQTAHGHQTDADDYTEQATNAAHPAAASQLSGQARQAQDLADAATRAATDAGEQLSQWETRGQTAARTYDQQATHAQQEISGATGDLVALPSVAGGPPSPVQVSRGDLQWANRVFPLSLKIPNTDWREHPGESFRTLTGRPLTPAEIMALRQVAQEHENQPRGNLLDAAGGYVHTATFGLFSFGDPDTKRYTGGEDTALIPLDPNALAIDGDRLAATDGSRVDLSNGFDTDSSKFVDGTMSAHAGSTDAPLQLQQYYDPAGHGSLTWWTTPDQAAQFNSEQDIKNGLALDDDWGPRTAVREATVPGGTDITALIGEAKPIVQNDGTVRPGGGLQIRVREFDPGWITREGPVR